MLGTLITLQEATADNLTTSNDVNDRRVFSIILLLVHAFFVTYLIGRLVFSVHVAIKRVRSSNRRDKLIADFFIYLFTDEDSAGRSDHKDAIQNRNEMSKLT
ncbi:uncharacterized protein LOC134177418 [Corticium candelabrum]|uniref:uncharacterized protein LOC134177418 n=1 Tax=Corticium candelabrum TaxID=121492 RepID=UPI002E263F8F|nr:uncharacterized protein LOC134177418 [Corticium candelabrum]